MQLALMNRRVFVVMEKLNWIFDRDDVIELRFINQIDNRCQSRTLAAARGAGHQHDTVLNVDYLAQLFRQVEFFETRGTLWDNPHDNRMRAALLEDVYAKTTQPRDAERDISRAELVQTLGRTRIVANHDLGNTEGVGGSQLFEAGNGHRLEFADQFNLRRTARRKD